MVRGRPIPRPQYLGSLRALLGAVDDRGVGARRPQRGRRSEDEPGRRHRHLGEQARPMTSTRPAFYAARPGRGRDWWTLLHPPYTAWHLSYVVIGATLAPRVDGTRLLATVLAF